MSSSTYKNAGTGCHAVSHLLHLPWGWTRAIFPCLIGGLCQAHGGNALKSDATFEEGVYAGKAPSHS